MKVSIKVYYVPGPQFCSVLKAAGLGMASAWGDRSGGKMRSLSSMMTTADEQEMEDNHVQSPSFLGLKENFEQESVIRDGLDGKGSLKGGRIEIV